MYMLYICLLLTFLDPPKKRIWPPPNKCIGTFLTPPPINFFSQPKKMLDPLAEKKCFFLTFLGPPPKKEKKFNPTNWTFTQPKKILDPTGEKTIKFFDPPTKKIMQLLKKCIDPTIRIGRESWCLPYAGFSSATLG